MSDGQFPLILLGAGGHAKVLLSQIRDLGRRIVGICDPALAQCNEKTWRNLPVLGGDSALESFDHASIELVNGIGFMPRSSARQLLYRKLANKGFRFATLVH